MIDWKIWPKFLASLSVEEEMSLLLEAGLGNVTCFDLWDVRIWDTSKNLKRACT